MTVSSGLAFVPMAMTPTYCATRAAIHSYNQSLSYQLRETSVEVLEPIPPYVATGLMGEHQARDPRAMPLEAFIAEVMEILRTQPDAAEICVGKVHPVRFAASEGQGRYDPTFEDFNHMLTAAVAQRE